MVLSNEDLSFQESIVIQATLPILLVSLIQKKSMIIHKDWLFNHFQNSETSAVLRIMLLSLLAGECAMQLYFMALTAPNVAVCFTLTAHQLLFHMQQTFLLVPVVVDCIYTVQNYHKWLDYIHGWCLNDITRYKLHIRIHSVWCDSYRSVGGSVMNLLHQLWSVLKLRQVNNIMCN